MSGRVRIPVVAGLCALGLCATGAAVAAPAAGVIELPEALFAIGDDPARAAPGFDDSGWTRLSTLAPYERQGFAGYDGFSWYRIHVSIPASIRTTVHWPRRLHLYLSSIDDVDETWFNGVRVGAMGQMPEDPRGYSTRWNGLRDYYVAVATGLVHFDADNVIAVRVYDGGGNGGFYRDMPTVSLADMADGLVLDVGHTAISYGTKTFRAQLRWRNEFPVVLDGRMDYDIVDALQGVMLRRASRPFHIAASGTAEWPLEAPQRAGIEVRFRFTEATSGAVTTATLHAPYLLTPPTAASPRLNGAKVLGVHPGSPVIYRVAATGRAPLTLSVAGLPAGLSFDAVHGVITGKAPPAGDYPLTLTARNRLGAASRTLTLRVGDTLALTPPMGWNSWNAYGLGVDAAKVRAVAAALVDSGLADHGWTYVNIDDGWEAAARTADGGIATNEKFPDMPALSAFLHERGLRFGIYSSPGPVTCGRFLGSLGAERRDADTYARWGVDYLKYDQCSYEQLLPAAPSVADYQAPYRLMQAALAAQPRDIVYNLCQYGLGDVWTWGASVGGNSWRTTGDIEDDWRSVAGIIDAQSQAAPFARPGHWNDPDMLVVGEVGWGGALHSTHLTPDEQYTHISLWALLAAPLLLGNELIHLDPFTRNLLVNDEVIAIDQDPKGSAATRAWAADGWEIWVRELADGRHAVGVVNRGDTVRDLTLADRVAALHPGVALRDAWRQRDLGPLATGFSARLPAHGVLLLVAGHPGEPNS
jgi:hypothetical protein